MVKFVDRVKMYLTTTGTGTVTFGSVVSGFQSLSDASVVDADVVRYTIESGTNYESGTGTIGLTGSTYTMARSPSSSSESDNSAINLGSGAVCFLTMLAEDVVQNLADLDNVSSTAPAGGQNLSWDSGSSSWVPASPPGGITSVGNYAGLPASPSETDLAWVQDQKALYVYDGTEWDRFYTDTNATPDWTTEPPSTAVKLAIDGTATVQTVVASDPEGFPIEYSYDTNPSNQTQATISQSNNVFTITPSTSDSNEGSFTLRYGASDGIHSTSRSTVYNLVFYTNPDLPNATYDNVSFTMQSGNGSIWFNTGGTKLYGFGYTDDKVSEYDLSTAWDISTASYNNVNFSIVSQEVSGRAMCFSGNGNHFYIAGSSNDDLFQYDMTTPFDVSTASYSNKALLQVGSTPSSAAFNTDGTKAYVSDQTHDRVYQWDLSTAYDISTASNKEYFTVAAQESSLYGFAFNNDGSKLYATGTSSDKVHEYDLSTNFDVTTASYNNVKTPTLTGGPISVFFRDDGLKMYTLVGSVVYQYSVG
tara:strand:+ start:264 stop:1859 length:1596 start_codon:yes stop_codon:yes gene_type:complete